MLSNSIAASDLQHFIDRLVEREESRRLITDEIRDIIREATDSGFESHAIKAIVRKQLMDDRQKQREKLKAETLSLYEAALQMDLPL